MSLVRIAFLLALAALPLAELALLIKVGGLIGGWWMFLIVVATAVLGMTIIVQNGFSAALRMQQAMMRGEAPFAPMMDSGMVVLAGLLLITPGLIADAVGLLLLVPPLRALAAAGLTKLMLSSGVVTVSATFEEAAAQTERSRATPGQEGYGGRPHGDQAGGPVIDGEFQRVDERPIEPRDGGGSRQPP